MKNIGLFGGTFDPIHYGHLEIAKCFLEKCNLEKCIFIPAKVSPFKTEEERMFSDEERFEQVKKAIKDNAQFEISDYEIFNDKNEVSYSIDTIRFFHNKFKKANLFFLIGTDQALHFEKWKDYSEILKLVRIAIANRPEKITLEEKNYINKIFNNSAIWLDNDIFPITSTEIRERINKDF